MDATNDGAAEQLEILGAQFAGEVQRAVERSGTGPGGQDVTAFKKELDAALCSLYEKDAEIRQRFHSLRDELQDGGVRMASELEGVHHLLFRLETFTWLQLADSGDAVERRPIDYVASQREPMFHSTQVRRMQLLCGDHGTATTELPFAGTSVGILAQQSMVCYLLPPPLSSKYCAYFGLPLAFQKYVTAFRGLDEFQAASEGHGTDPAQFTAALDALLALVLGAELAATTTDSATAARRSHRPQEATASVPVAWKWQLIKDIDLLEDQLKETTPPTVDGDLGVGGRAGSGSVAYKLWLMLHSKMPPQLLEDNYLELKLLITHAGVDNALEPLLRLRPPDSTGEGDLDMIEHIVEVCGEQGQLPLLAALPLPSWLSEQFTLLIDRRATRRHESSSQL